MAVELSDLIVHATDKHGSAAFLADVLDLDVQPERGQLVPVATANRVAVAYMEDTQPFTRQRFAFLVAEDEFDAAYGRLLDRRVRTWADPARSRPGELNHDDVGGRGLYFDDPDGHLIHILTRPYGPAPD